jgi:hypothetical protein
VEVTKASQRCKRITENIRLISQSHSAFPENLNLTNLKVALGLKEKIIFYKQEIEGLLDIHLLVLREKLAKKMKAFYISGFYEDRAWALSIHPKTDEVSIKLIDKSGNTYRDEPLSDKWKYTDFKNGISLRVPPKTDDDEWAMVGVVDLNGNNVGRLTIYREILGACVESGIYLATQAVGSTDAAYGYFKREENQWKKLFLENEELKNGKFDRASPFVEGHAWVEIDGKVYFVNDKEEITGGPIESSETQNFFEGNFGEGLVWCKSIDSASVITRFTLYDFKGVKTGVERHFFGIPENNMVFPFSEKVSRARINDAGIYCFLDIRGNQVFPGEFFAYASDFHEGVAVVKKSDGRLFYIDKETGENAFGYKFFDEANDFHDGIARVKSGQGWWFIDHTGENIFGLGVTFTEAGDFSDGLAQVTRRQTGTEAGDFSDGLAQVKFQTQTGCIGKDGHFYFRKEIK